MGGGDSIVKTSLAIEREVEDARSIRDTGASGKRKEPSYSSRKNQKTALVMKVNSGGTKKEQRAFGSFNVGAGADRGDWHRTPLSSKLFF